MPTCLSASAASVLSPQSSVFSIARPSQRHTRSLSGQLPVIDHGHAVDHDVAEPLAVLVGLFESRPVTYGLRVEDGQIRGKPRLDETAVLQPRGLRSERGHLADRLLEAQELLFANVMAEDPRGRPPASRV